MNTVKRHRGFTIWEFSGGIALILIGAAIFYPMMTRPKGTGGHRPSCQNRLKQLSLGIFQYIHDHDEHLPSIVGTVTSVTVDPSTRRDESVAYGWADAIYPYIKNPQTYHCTTLHQRNNIPPNFAPLSHDCTDYWLNGRLAGLKLNQATSPALTLLFGEGNDGGDMTDARYSYSALPAPWIKNQSSPAYRHKGMANYAFLDGHVKALKPTQINSELSDGGQPTFAVK